MSDNGGYQSDSGIGSVWFNFGRRIVVVALALALAQWLIVPGFLAMDVPSHSDLWRYYAVAHELPLKIAIVSPRPLMLLALKALAPIHDSSVFFLLLNLPAIIFVGLASIAADAFFKVKTPLWAQFLLSLAIFGTSTFYVLNPLDYGGFLAGAFFGLQVIWLCEARNRGEQGREINFFVVATVAALLGYVSFETKPTFALLIPLAPLILLSSYPPRKVLFGCAVCAGFVALSVVKDVVLKSPFIEVNNAASPYKIALNPISILNAAGFYLRHILPWQLIPIALFGLWQAWRCKRWVLAVLVFAPILAVMPMCAIPSRLLPMYSWFGTVIVAVMVAALLMKRRIKFVSMVAVGLVLFSILAGMTGASLRKPSVKWTVSNHQFNRQAAESLKALQARVAPGERILVAGRLAAFSPFNNDRFIALTSPVDFTWKVAYPPVDAPLVAMSHDSKVHVAQADIRFDEYDRVAIFGPDGRLVHLGPAGAFSTMRGYEVAIRFYCPDGMSIPDADTRLAKTLACLSNYGEYQAAEEYGEVAGDNSTNQWVWYWRGRASEALQHRDEALRAFEKAASIEPAPVFLDAATRVKALPEK